MASLLASRILDYLDGRRQDMTDLVERLARAESPSTDPGAQEAVFGLLVEALAARGFRARRVRGRKTGGLLLSRPQSRRRGAGYQLLLGHCDTVWPTGTLDRMPLERRGNELKGPGVYDMKGGLVQGLFAVEALRALGNDPVVTPLFLINSDEEVGSFESSRYVRRFAARADRVLVLEPSMGLSGRLKTARKGIGRFTVRVKGKAAHAGLEPGRGASAILELSRVIQALFELNDIRRGISVNVGTIDGGLRPNIVAPEASAIADVRVPTREDARRVEQAIRDLTASTPGTTLEITGGIGRPPLEKTPRNQKLFNLARIAADQLGIPLEEATAGGGSDGNTASLLAPTLDGLGAVGDGAHASNEFLLIDKMVERAALLALLVDSAPLATIRSLP